MAVLSTTALKELISKEFGKGGAGNVRFAAGEEVDCFFRSHLHPDNLVPALDGDEEDAQSTRLSVGVTVGWFSATVLEDCAGLDCLRFKQSTWVRVLIQHTHWFDRGGRYRDFSGGLEIRAHPGMLRHKPAGAGETCMLGFGSSATDLGDDGSDGGGAAAAAAAPLPPSPPNAVATCPGEHGLAPFVTAVPNYHCDICGLAGLPAGTPMSGCRICDFDACANCAAAAGASNNVDTRPWLSFLVLRWGGTSSFLVPHAEHTSAWGAGGCTISDSTIERFFERTVLPAHGMRFRVLTAFVGGSEQLRALRAPSLAAQLRRGAPAGCQIAALYFLWPVCIREGGVGSGAGGAGGGADSHTEGAAAPAPPPRHPFTGEGYVPQTSLLGLMEQLEAQCVHTRFPHPSPLYRVLLSKAWQAQLCGDATARLPPTTAVGRGMVVASPAAAARTAIGALRQLGAWRTEDNDLAVKGVVKLGFSWQAVDVRAFVGEAQLRDALCALLHPARSPDTTHSTALVQEWVEHDCEMRLFVVSGTVRHADFTRFEDPGAAAACSGETTCGSFTDAEFGVGRETALQKWFQGDAEALAYAEGQALALAARLQRFLLTQFAEQPPAVRIDVRVKYHPAGAVSTAATSLVELPPSARVTVSTAEITELGFSMHGWPEGPEVVHAAMLQACYPDVGFEGAAKRLKS